MKATTPSRAIERLAVELMSLSDEDWASATARWRAGLGWDAVFGPAWEEISERLCDIDWRTLAASGKADDAAAAGAGSAGKDGA